MYLTNKDLGYILKKVKPIFGVELGNEFLRLPEDLIDGRFKKFFRSNKRIGSTNPSLNVDFYPSKSNQINVLISCNIYHSEYSERDFRSFTSTLNREVESFVNSVFRLKYSNIQGAEVFIEDSFADSYISKYHDPFDSVCFQIEICIRYA